MTFEEIRDQILSDIENNIEGVNTDEPSLWWCQANIWAHIAWGIRKKLEWALAQAFCDTADYDYLVRHAASKIGLPKAATGSEGTVKIYGDAGSSFDAGLELSTEDGILFQTTEGGTIQQGQTYIVVDAESVDTGALTNIPKNTTLIVLSPPSGIESEAEAAENFDGGTDKESREEYLSRYLFFLRVPPAGGTKSDYVRWALDIQGVDRAAAFGPNELGDEFLGRVVVVPVAEGGAQVSDEVLKAVETHIEGSRPVCSKDFSVFKHTDKKVTVDIDIRAYPGYEFGDFGETKTVASSDEIGLVITVSPDISDMNVGDYVVIKNVQRKIASRSEGDKTITLAEPLGFEPAVGEEILAGGPLWDEIYGSIKELFDEILPGETLFLAQIFNAVMSSIHVMSCYITAPTNDVIPMVDSEKVEMCVLERVKLRRWTA